MKNSLLMLIAGIGLLSACAKEDVRPTSTDTAVVPVSIEKELGNTKQWKWCGAYDGNGHVIASGKICDGTGTECGRSKRCTAMLGITENPDEVVFEDLTRKQFIDMWNTDEGMTSLLSKGVYEVDEH